MALENAARMLANATSGVWDASVAVDHHVYCIVLHQRGGLSVEAGLEAWIFRPSHYHLIPAGSRGSPVT